MSHRGFIYQFLTSEGCFPGSPISSPKCNPADTFGGGELNGAMGLAFDYSSRTLYAANSGAGDIAEFVPRPAPVVTTRPSTPTGPGAATVSGHIDAFQAADISECYFGYGAGPSSDLGSSVPCEQPSPISAPADVTAKLAGLQPFTSYRYRLVVVPGDGVGLPSRGRGLTFTVNPSNPPGIDATSSSGVEQTSATVIASINPNLASTTYVVRYGTARATVSTPCQADRSAKTTSITRSPSTSPASPGDHISLPIVAINFSGTTTGPDQTFATAGGGGSTANEHVTPATVTPIGPESLPNPDCSGSRVGPGPQPAGRGPARAAKRASRPPEGARPSPQAARLARQARRLGSRAKQCEGTGGRGSR